MKQAAHVTFYIVVTGAERFTSPLARQSALYNLLMPSCSMLNAHAAVYL